MGRKLDSVTVEDLGRARRIVASKEETTFVDGAGSEDDISGRINQIKAQVEETTSDFDREKLQERLAKLSGGVAIIKVGRRYRGRAEREEEPRRGRAFGHTRGRRRGHPFRVADSQFCGPARDLKTWVSPETRPPALRFSRPHFSVPIKLISQNTGVSGEVILADSLKGEGELGL